MEIQDYARALYLPVSYERLRAYVTHADGDDLEMVTTYLWNIKLSEALYPALQALEVTLRNSIHAALATKYGTTEWYRHGDLLLPSERDAVAKAKTRVAKRKGEVEVTAGRVVAELSFGFWTALFRRPYAARLWGPRDQGVLQSVFPEAPRYARNQKVIYERHDQVRKLRNRVFHFEPIWNRPDLPNEHRQIVETIGWISPTLRDTVEFCDRFPDVFAHGRQDLKDKVQTYLATI